MVYFLPMGMFDRLYVETRLPLNEELERLPINWREEEFQTKSLECFLVRYTIREDGTLESWGFGGLDDDEELSDEEIQKTWKKVPYHGTVDFYTSFDGLEGNDWWVEFRAYFIYGVLDKIELVESRKTPSSLREARELLFMETLQVREQTLRSRVRKALRKVPGVRRAGYAIVSACSRANSAISRFIYSWI